MDFEVIFRDTFLEDLERIVRWIAHHNPEAARKLAEMIIQQAENLSFFPERHPRVRLRPAIRRFIVKKHFKAFYRVRHDTKTVDILRCWDARQEADPHIQ